MFRVVTFVGFSVVWNAISAPTPLPPPPGRLVGDRASRRMTFQTGASALPQLHCQTIIITYADRWLSPSHRTSHLVLYNLTNGRRGHRRLLIPSDFSTLHPLRLPPNVHLFPKVKKIYLPLIIKHPTGQKILPAASQIMYFLKRNWQTCTIMCETLTNNEEFETEREAADEFTSFYICRKKNHNVFYSSICKNFISC